MKELLALYAHLHASDEPLPDADTIQMIGCDIEQNPDLHYFGLYVGGKLLSLCTISIVPNLTPGCRPYGVIESVVTHKDIGRRGYGKAVLNHALEYAWNRNCYKVMLMTGRKKEGTFRFYEEAGFDSYPKQAFLASQIKPNKALRRTANRSR